MSKKRALTEPEMMERLLVKYGQTEDRPSWAFVPKPRNAAGFDANRTIDAYVMGLWPSRGLELIAIEIKSSRSDWLRELKEGEKGEAFGILADRFYLAVGDKDIVKEGELPETWGLMIPYGRGLRVMKEAPLLRPRESDDFPPGFNRSFLAALLRAATKTQGSDPEAIQLAKESERRKVTERHEKTQDILRTQLLDKSDMLDRVAAAAGVRSIGDFIRQASPEDVGQALRAVLNGEDQVDEIKRTLRRHRSSLEQMIEAIDKQIGQ